MLAFPIIYSAYVGVADSARAKALEIARRKAGDESLAYLVGEMENAFAATEMSLEMLIGLAETGAPGPETTSRAMICRTLVGPDGAIRTVDQAMQVAGGGAFYRDLGLERAFRDVQGARFHPLQAKPQLRYTGAWRWVSISTADQWSGDFQPGYRRSVERRSSAALTCRTPG
jgi:alkylation response protein AidB-like acyl-CoA dehydrogenase